MRKKQKNYPYKYVLEYIPTRFENVSEQQVADRESLYRFKDGIATDEEVERIVQLVKEVTEGDSQNWAVAFIPASNRTSNMYRYTPLEEKIDEELKIPVALWAIERLVDEPHIHSGGRHEFAIFGIDEDFVKGKNVVLIDDVITKGNTFRDMADSVMKKGAKSVYGVFYAKTVYPTDDNNNK